MWGGNHPFVRKHLSQDGIITDRFLAEDIERHSCQSSFRERSQQRLFIDQIASRTVHQIGTWLEQSQFMGAKQLGCPALCPRESGMQRHEIGPLQHLFLAVECHPDLLRPVWQRQRDHWR